MSIIWITTITVLAVIPHSDDGIMVSSNATSSGMEKHIAGYFLAALLCYYARTKMDEGHRAPPLNPLRGAPIGAIQRGISPAELLDAIAWDDVSIGG